MSPGWKQKLVSDAQTAIAHSYAPYSGLGIGAAVLLETGETFVGCNVENDSYGLTICAERAAIVAAVAAVGKRIKSVQGRDKSIRIRAIAIAASKEGTIPYPCGACRQVIAQFGPAAIVIYRAGGRLKQTSMEHLLPEQFVL
ncbi:MAG: cytidine deaminase [Candidatus Dormibacteraceae bacterium]